MNDKEQRVAIAEACGNMKWSFALPEKTIGCDVPDYLNDLNDMHFAESFLSRSNLKVYINELHKMTSSSVEDVVCATAAKRAEAFLKTIGKWKDSNE